MMNALNQQLTELSQRAKIAINSWQLDEAKRIIQQVLTLVPNNIAALADLALVESRAENYDVAYDLIQRALSLCRSENNDVELHLYAYDTGAEIAQKTERWEEARWLGRQAMQQRLQLAAQKGSPALPLPDFVPALSDNRAENIISYSLFGDKPRYNEVAVMNAKIALTIYPEWTCRFYVDDSVPSRTIARLQQYGAEIVDMTGSAIHGLFWRFLVADNANVKRFIVRDADSLLSYKERAAVDEWLASGKHFHVMRDSVLHGELILAGMWGGCGGVWHDMHERIVQNHARFADRTIDQQFLRYAVWNTVAQSVCCHDAYALGADSRPFPLNYEISETEREPYFHIGMINAAKITHVSIGDETAKRVRWFVIDEHDAIVCWYENEVDEQHNITVVLPNLYTRKIEQGVWRILTQTIPQTT